MHRLTFIIPFGKALYEDWTQHRPTRLAAALAYYGMFSFAPMLFVILTVAGIFIDTLAMADEIFDRMALLLGPETAEFIRSTVINASQRASGATTLSSLISLGALLYAATGLFAHLKYSLNVIWQVPPEEEGGMIGFVLTRLLAFALVLGVGLLVVLATVLSVGASILTTYFSFGFDTLTGNLISFTALLTLSFAILYRFLPDTKVSWRDVWLGALVTALLFTVGRWGLGFYFSHSSVGSAFEAAGALAIVLIAIYYGAQIFLVGAIITKNYAEQFGSRRDT